MPAMLFRHKTSLQTYATYALERPEALRIVGVAEPREYTRATFAAAYVAPIAWFTLRARQSA